MTSPGASRPDNWVALLNSRYRAPLLTYFARRLNSRSDAEDLTQETFVRIIRYSEGRGDEIGDGLIFSIAANLLRDHRRRGQARRRSAHASLTSYVEGEFASDRGWLRAEAELALLEEVSPERILLARESLARVLGALGELKPRTQDVFLLYRLEGMRQREIANLMGISVSAVEKHIVKALSHLTESSDKL